MPKLIAKTDQVLEIEGRGTFVCLPKEDAWDLDPTATIHKRERIQIRTPEGRLIETYIKEIEFINRGRGRGGIALLLPREFSKRDVPESSEVWLQRNGDEPIIEPL